MNEIRLNSEGENDDICIDCDFIHLEQMTANGWWLGIYKGDKMTSFNLVADGDGVKCTLQENELKTKKVKFKKIKR